MMPTQDATLEEENIEHEFKFIITKEMYEFFTTKKLQDLNLGKHKIEFLPVRKKQREYIYFDTKEFDLYKHGMQVSIRKREKDYIITFKQLIDNQSELEILSREEKNIQISDEIGRKIFQEGRLTTELAPTVFEEIRSLLDNNFISLEKISNFHVESHRYDAQILNTVLFEISYDKIIYLKDRELFEIELELRYIKQPELQKSIENINSLLKEIIRRLQTMIESVDKFKDIEIIDNQTSVTKLARVLNQNNNFIDILETDKLIDVSRGENIENSMLKYFETLTEDAYVIVPVSMNFTYYPDYMVDPDDYSKIESLKRLKKLDPVGANKELNRYYFEGRKKIIHLFQQSLEIELNEIPSIQNSFTFLKFLNNQRQYFFVFLFHANNLSKITNHISYYKTVEEFLNNEILGRIVNRSGDSELFTKIQVNFGLGNLDADVITKGDKIITHEFREIKFCEIHKGKEQANRFSFNQAYERAELHLSELINKRYKILKIEGKGPAINIRNKKSKYEVTKNLTIMLRDYHSKSNRKK
ncbi:MAG: CYTH domain-containing protein [Leptospiraceae bacterium]|nr:CYTH domain-containing protein [Leptospiraceae bacterium]